MDVNDTTSNVRRVRTLFLSDVHLGSKAAKADFLLDFLRCHEAETIVLVGDIDGDVNARMREAGARARADSAAYGLVRLTLRRR